MKTDQTLKLVPDPNHPGCLVSEGHKGDYRYPMVVVKRGRGSRRRVTSTTMARLLLEHLLGRRLRKAEETLHSCHFTKCLNIAHLSAGSHTENERQKWAAGRGFAPKGERNGNARLKADYVRQIRRAAAVAAQPVDGKVKRGSKGSMYRDMAKIFRVSPATIVEIVSGRRWKHVA